MLLLPGGSPQAGVGARVRRSPDPAAEPGRSSGGGAGGTGRGRQPPPGGPLPTRGATPAPAPRSLKPGAPGGGGGPGRGLPLRPPDFLRAPHFPARPLLPSPAQPCPALPSPPLGAACCRRSPSQRAPGAAGGAAPAVAFLLGGRRRGTARRGEVSTLLWFFGFVFFLEMVGLGNSCRGMKSPPLLVAALMACIIVLGFNYWIASSRSVDLQGRIMELEVKVHRAAVERGAVELKKNEFQGELEKQRQQIDKIQSLHSLQMENANRVHQEEKAVLMSNITVNDRVIQSLRENLKELQTEYGKLQLDVYWFQKNQTNLQRKFSYDLSQCINQMKELKEQCEERIDELTKKGSDIPQIKENKDFSEDSKRNSQVNIQLPALKQTEFRQADLEQQKPNEDVLKAVPTVKKIDLLQAKERISGLADSRREEPKAEEEKLSSQLKNPQDSFKAAAGHKEMLPESEKELTPSEDEKHVAGQDALQLAAEQAASEEIEREQLLNYDAKQDDSPTGKAGKQEHEALNQDRDVAYNLDENEAESEMDKEAALAGIEHVQNPEDMKNHLSVHDERQRL